MTARAPLLSDEEIEAGLENLAEEIGYDQKGQWGWGFRNGGEFSRTLYEAERNRLLDEIERLKEMVPKWVPVAQKIALDIQGWLPLDDQKCGDNERLWLMVPPIPLPKEGE